MNKINRLAMLRRFAPNLYASRRLVELDEIELQEKRARAFAHIAADANGMLGVTFDGSAWVNHDDGSVYGTLGEVVRDAVRGELAEMRRALIASRGNASQVQNLLEDAAQIQNNIPQLPQYITLDHLCRKYRVTPNYHNVVLGETVNAETGQFELVSGDMTDFVHGIVTGMTGFGKSWQLKAMAKQLVVSGDCDLVFIDYGVNTFGRLAQYGRYQIAEDPDIALAVFRVLIQEMHRRRDLMAQYPECEKLEQYNEIAGSDERPIVLFCDEAAVLFDGSKDLREAARDLTGRGRKFGIGAVFGGTDFKVGTMPSETRGNCGLRIAMHIEEPQLSRSIIHSTAAVNLDGHGRALARLPGVKGLFEIQCPAIERWDDLPDSRQQIVIQPAECDPEADDIDDPSLPDEDRVIALHDAGESDTAIARRVFKYGNPHYIQKVRDILACVVVADDVVVGGESGVLHNNNTNDTTVPNGDTGDFDGDFSE